MSKKINIEEKKNKLFAYSKYSSLILQMAAIVFLGAMGGKALDNYFKTDFWTVILVLITAFFALWYLFRTMLNK
ncbi:MAG: AtpZ/AtpI family protein [Bacteroidales bacterium]